MAKRYLGKSKATLDLVDLDADLQSAVQEFGHFVKYVNESEGVVMRVETGGASAFSVLEALCQRKLPSKIVKEKPSKQDFDFSGSLYPVKLKIAGIIHPCFQIRHDAHLYTKGNLAQQNLPQHLSI